MQKNGGRGGIHGRNTKDLGSAKNKGVSKDFCEDRDKVSSMCQPINRTFPWWGKGTFVPGK